VAWFAESLLTGTELEQAGWPVFLQHVLANHVAITTDQDEPPVTADTPFWSLVLCRAFEAFMTANGLDQAVRRRIEAGTVAKSWTD